jgi:phage regulatory protein, rha family
VIRRLYYKITNYSIQGGSFLNIEQKSITSIEVADMIGKEHKNILRDIRGYSEELGELKIEPSDFFTESSYENERGKTYPCYLVTKKGCEFIAHKLTGIKGTEFTAKYINRFHDMEEIIQQPKSPMELLELEFKAIKQVEDKVDAVDSDLQNFKKDMPILGIEESRITAAVRKKGVNCLGGKNSEAYQDKSLRGKVYSDIYSQLKREFGVDTYKAIKRSQAETAVEIIEVYELPIVLEEEINDLNAQMAIV